MNVPRWVASEDTQRPSQAWSLEAIITVKGDSAPEQRVLNTYLKSFSRIKR